MSPDEDEGGAAERPSARWGDDLDLPERVIVVPAVPDAGGDAWEGPPTEAMPALPDEPDETVAAAPPPAAAPEPTIATSALPPSPPIAPDVATTFTAAAAVPLPPRRDETDPGALRPSAPEPVSISRGPSRSRRVVSRLRAFIGLVLVVILSGVGLAAAIGAAVLLVAFVLKRAFGS